MHETQDVARPSSQLSRNSTAHIAALNPAGRPPYRQLAGRLRQRVCTWKTSRPQRPRRAFKRRPARLHRTVICATNRGRGPSSQSVTASAKSPPH